MQHGENKLFYKIKLPRPSCELIKVKTLGALLAAIVSEKVAIAFSGAEEEKKMPMNLLLGQRR